jgi:hypothetical protein
MRIPLGWTCESAGASEQGGLTPAAYTIAEFCAAYRISKAHLFNLLRRGEGPRIFRAGRRTLISAQSAIEWVRRSEALADAQQLRGGTWP